MFARLFADSGLSLDRLRVLLEVGAAGSIVKAAGGDPVRQSQFSRQIKELEDFFRTRLVERHGKGIRLTAGGRELARISRFFLLGLSNFQRGCLAEEQTLVIGAGATVIQEFLLPVLAAPPAIKDGRRHVVEVAGDDEIERRLQDLTLDFGVVTASAVNRPLQMKELGSWRLNLWIPRAVCRDERQAVRAFDEQRLPLALARELPAGLPLKDFEACVVCSSYLEALTALRHGSVAAFLPDFLSSRVDAGACFRAEIRGVTTKLFRYRLAWNPRLLRLNPGVIRRRDQLVKAMLKAEG